MKVSQKRTCEGCKALQHLSKHMECSLGYKNKAPFDGSFILKTVPQEPCPKPMNYKDLIEAGKIYKKTLTNNSR